jgi:diguanylate cyclase (GGDEF)-like protein/PAS domain S-box-containing protein
MAGGRPGAVTTIAAALRAPGGFDQPETLAAAEQMGLGIVTVGPEGSVSWSDSVYRWHGRPRWQRVRTVTDSLTEVQVGREQLRAAYDLLATGDLPSDGSGVRFVVTGEHAVAHTVYLLPIGRGTALVSGRPFEATEWDQRPGQGTAQAPGLDELSAAVTGGEPAPVSPDVAEGRLGDEPQVSVDLTASSVLEPSPRRAGLSLLTVSGTRPALGPHPSQWRALFAASPVAMVVLDRLERVRQVNDAYCQLMGVPREQVLALEQGPLLAAAFAAAQAQAGAGARDAAPTAEHRLARPDGEHRWVRLRESSLELDGEWQRLITVEDVTAARETEYRLRREALHDQLTGLPNRRLLVDRLDRALTRGRRSQSGVAVFFIDVDDLKRVNDTYGHAGGDLMIVTVGRALRAALRDADTLARVGGDEFIAICEDLENGYSLDEVGDRLIHAVTTPLVLDGDEVSISLSVGVATPAGDGEDAERLLQRADAAMYRAKAAGGGRLSASPQHAAAGAGAGSEVSADDWVEALGAGQLRLDYLPVARCDGRGLIGVEARLRWHHPRLGDLTAVDLLERPGTNRATAELVRWSVSKALADVQAACPAGTGPVTVWLKVPYRALVQHSVSDAVAAAFRDRTGPDTPRLVLEVHEKGLAALVRRGKLPRELDRLASTEQVSVGVSRFDGSAIPLGILARMPLGSVKFHRDLVHDASHSVRAAAFLAGLATVAGTLGAVTVAAGTDHAEHLQAARAAGCAALQGKCVGHRVEADGLPAVLAAGVVDLPDVIAPGDVVPAVQPALVDLPDPGADIAAALAAETGVALPGDFDAGPLFAEVSEPGQDERQEAAGGHLLLRAPRFAPLIIGIR